MSVTTRRELIDAVAARYRAAGRNPKKEILDEFVKVKGFHRKHAIRALKKSAKICAGSKQGVVQPDRWTIRRLGLR